MPFDPSFIARVVEDGNRRRARQAVAEAALSEEERARLREEERVACELAGPFVEMEAEETDDEGDTLRAERGLAEHVRSLIPCDSKGEFYFVPAQSGFRRLMKPNSPECDALSDRESREVVRRTCRYAHLIDE